MILIAAAQSISLDEIRNVLAVVPNAKDHDPRRVPFTKDIENLCSPLATFGKPREGDADDSPLLKLCHKTVEDFFLQDPKDLEIDPNSKLRKYFVTYKRANEAMAVDCLTYLRYKRYENPTLKIGAILSKPIAKEHAFLPYAAMFWTQHCDWIGQFPAREVTEAALNFLQSNTLRTCLEVQAHVGPYLFGRYVGKKRLASYQMCVKGSRDRDNDSFGVPLPQFLDRISSQGFTLDRSMCHFIGEWREVLVQHPDGLSSCLPLRKFAPTCHLTPLGKHENISVSYLEDQFKDLNPKNLQLLRAAFRGKTLWADVLFHQSQGLFLRLQIPLFTKKKSAVRSEHRALLPDGDLRDWTIDLASRTEEPDTIEAWKVDPNDLGMRWISHDKSNLRKVPLAFSRANVGRRKGSWQIQSTQSFEPDALSSGSMQVVHVTWKSRKDMPDTNARFPLGQHNHSESSSSESEDEEEDSPAPVSPESASDDDSDDDSDHGSTTTASRATETADETADTDSESETEEGQITDCLIVTPCNNDPSWHPWPGPSQVWSRIGCATHPFLPLLAVSHTARQLEVIDTVTRVQKTKHLPDVADLQDTPLASLRGMYFVETRLIKTAADTDASRGPLLPLRQLHTLPIHCFHPPSEESQH